MVDDITERKRIEEALRVSEEKHRTLFETMASGVVYQDSNGRIVSANPAAERILGLTLDQMQGRTSTDPRWKAIHEDGSDFPGETHPSMIALKTGKEVRNVVMGVFDPNSKEYRWININAAPQFKPGETKPFQVYATFDDITERKRVEEALRESERRLRRITDNMLDMVVETDLQGVCKYVSQSGKAVLGYDPKELVGKSLFDFIHPEDLGTVTETVQRAISTGRLWTGGRFECRYRHADGHYVWLENLANIVRDEKGQMIGSIIGSRDITERKESEEALRESEGKYRKLFEEAMDGIALADPDTGILLDCNQALAALVGRNRAELIGQPQAILHPPASDNSTFSPTFKLHTTTREGQVLETQVITATGEIREVEIKASQLYLQGRKMLQGIFRDITERKRMEDELGKFSQFRESIIDNANVWLDVLDENANIVVWNKAAEVISGYSREEVTGHGKIWEWLYPDEEYRKSIIDSVTEVLRSGRVDEDFETRIRRKDGQIRIISWNERNLLDEQGQVTGSIAIGQDVTGRKRMQEELDRYSKHLEELVAQRTQKLSESEMRFRELADLLPQIVFETDETGNVTFGNQAGFAITGYAQEDLDRGFNALQLFAPEERAKARDRIMRTLGGERSSGTEYRLQRKDGSTFPAIIFTAAALREGKTVGLRGIAIDITDRKRAEEELRAAKERLDYVVTSNPAVIFTSKPRADRSDYDVTYMSNRVVSMLGFKPEELIGHPEFWDGRVHPGDLRHYLAEVPHLWKDGQHAFEYRFLHKDGTYRWIREETKVIRDAVGKPVEVIGYWTDVTEWKRMEAELVKSQRFATIGETATMVGHDLRNPLQAITGTVYLAKRGLKSRKPAEKKTVEGLLESIDEQVLYMDKIVSDLHDYAQPLTPKFTETSLPELVKTLLSTVRVPATVKVSVETPKGFANVLVDSHLMRRVLTNLVINAIQAMPKGGKLAIRGSKKGETTIVSVQDTGTGIPEEHMDKLFSTFFTTKAKGQGLGLAVCKRLVEAQGGKITVESKPGKGTTFTISIPQRKNVR